MPGSLEVAPYFFFRGAAFRAGAGAAFFFTGLAGTAFFFAGAAGRATFLGSAFLRGGGAMRGVIFGVGGTAFGAP